jgi:Oxidoreductase family, NAD-binding Rossmann fold
MGNPVRIGFVGARFAAKFHWEALRRVYGVSLQMVGVTSKTPEARDAFAKETGMRSFDTFAELCAAVDVVDLCTPPSSHEALAVEALGLGKHVIIEKPLTGYFGASTFPKEQMLAVAMASCGRIQAAAKAAAKRVCYAENWVYAPAIQKERCPDSAHPGRGVSRGVALALLWPVEILRRRVAHGQGVPPVERGTLFEAG